MHPEWGEPSAPLPTDSPRELCHDLNNMLVTIRGCAELLLRESGGQPSNGKAEHYQRLILDSTNQAIQLALALQQYVREKES
jgi:nitrogen-specific signal transduction histidine kinase